MINEYLKQILKPIDKLFKVANLYKPNAFVLPTGFREFDNAMDGGVREGELITISGRTGEGKSLLAETLSSNFSKQTIPSLFFSYEMNPWYLRERFIKMGENEALLTYIPKDSVESSIIYIRDSIRYAKKEFACKVVFIDHLHYLIPLNQSTNSSLLIGGIVRELKKLAIKEEVVVFLIAHTKKIYSDESLDLSSPRDSSLISQESDYVFLIERKKINKKEFDKSSDTEWTNQSRITLAKNRRTGKLFYLDFNYLDNKLIPITKDYKYEQELL